MTSIVINGNAYSDDGSTLQDMQHYGYLTHLLPMIGDTATVAGQVATDAAQAALDAATASNGALALRGTSTTSLAVSAGTKTLTTQAGKQFAAGNYVTISRTSAPTTLMHGVVTSYIGSTLIVEVATVAGSGTFTDWTIALSGASGEQGPSGNGVMPYVAKTGAYTVVTTDRGSVIDCIGTFTLSFQACATLGADWSVYIRNSGTGVITLDPNGSETIDGGSTYDLSSGHAAFVQCDGSELRVVYDIGLTQTRYPIFSTVAASKTPSSVLDNIANVQLVNNLLTASQTGSIAQNGTNFVVGSSLGNGSATMSSVSSSSDGRTYVLRTMPSTQAWCVASDGTGFMALGSGVINAAYSAAGTSWAAVTALPSAPPFGVRFVGKSGVYLVRGSATTTTLYRTANNGTSWTTETALTASLTIFRVCAGLFVASVALTSSAYDTSATGLTGSWTNRALPGTANKMDSDYDGSLVAYNTTTGEWWRSTDAVNWTLQASVLFLPGNGVKTINGIPFSGATSVTVANGAATLHNGVWMIRQTPISSSGSVFAKIGNVIVDTKTLLDHTATDAATAIFEG